VRSAASSRKRGLKDDEQSDEEMVGNYLADDLVNPKTAKSMPKPVRTSSGQAYKGAAEQGYKELPVLDNRPRQLAAYRQHAPCRQDIDA